MKNFAVGSILLLLGVLGPQRDLGSRFDAAWALGLLMLAAFLAQQLTRSLRLPPLVGWVAAGLLLGPAGLKAVSPGPSLHLLHSFAALWVGFQVGLGPYRWSAGWRPAAALGLSTLAVFLAVAAGLALLVRLPWELALLIGALASLWGPFTTSAVLEDHGAVTWGLIGNGFGLLLLSAALVLLPGQGLLLPAALRFAGALWLSLLAGGLAAWLLCLLRICATPTAAMVGLVGSFALAALLVDPLQLCALLVGFAAGWVVDRHPDQSQPVRELARASQPLVSMVFFALAGAAIDLRALWPLAEGLPQIALLQALALVLLRGLALSRWWPAGEAGKPRIWLLLPRVALLFELLYHPGGGLADLLPEGPARLLRQAALADLLLHAFLFSTLAAIIHRLWRFSPGAIVQR